MAQLLEALYSALLSVQYVSEIIHHPITHPTNNPEIALQVESHEAQFPTPRLVLEAQMTPSKSTSTPSPKPTSLHPNGLQEVTNPKISSHSATPGHKESSSKFTFSPQRGCPLIILRC